MARQTVRWVGRQVISALATGWLAACSGELPARVERDSVAEPGALQAIAEGVVLEPAAADGLGTGPVQLLARGEVLGVRRAVDPARLPGRWRQLAGRRLRLHDAGAMVCEATVTEMFLLKRVALPLARRPVGRLDDATLAAAAWRQGSAAPMLVAAVQPDGGDCAGASWAAEHPALAYVAARASHGITGVGVLRQK